MKQAPVIYEGRVAGVIEALDLLNYMYKSNNPVISAKEIMKKDFCITYNDTPLDEINSLDFDGWIVTNKQGCLLGIVYKEDLVNATMKNYYTARAIDISNDIGFEFRIVGKGILDSMHDGVYITDSRGITIFINKAYTRISGIEKEEVIGIPMKELISKGLFTESASLIALEQNESVTIVDKFRNGKRCLVTSSPVHDEDGNIIMVVTNIRDITELLNLKTRVEQTELLKRKYYFELEQLRREQIDKKDIIGNSKEIEEVLEVVSKISEVDATVLITGETGVGKEVIAKEIHKKSLRKDAPFVKVNCASIPETLFESELFGYEKGAFTGAANCGKPGMFEVADKGTILLDEIGEIPLNIQSKLLRVLQEKQITRVGGTKVQKIDVRILAATNLNLKEQVEKGLFREDLYYRLNVIPIRIPALRERKEDIVLLAIHFLDLYNSKYNMNKKLDYSAAELLRLYPWPGNVRELKNLMERLVLICPNDIISDEYISKMISKKEVEFLYDFYDKEIHLNEAVAIVEKQLIYNALKNYKTTRKAAEALGISQPTVVRKANCYGIKLS